MQVRLGVFADPDGQVCPLYPHDGRGFPDNPSWSQRPPLRPICTMIDLARGIFDGGFMPHGYCYQWKPEIVWLHALSDALIAMAYFAIPIILMIFVSRRKDLVFGWMFVMFSAFIWLCGTTHVLSIYTIWNGTYGLTGSVKLITGVVSMATAVALVPLMPKALALPSPRQLREVNANLSREIEARRLAEEQLRHLNADLELRVRERSADLEESNRLLRAEVAERIRTEQALRDSEARFRQLANSMPQLVWSAEPDGTVNYFNDRHQDLPGIVAYDDGTWNWEAALHPDDLEATARVLKEAVATGSPYEVEHRARTRSGAFRWQLSRGVPVVNDRQEVVQWYGSATDIHEQKEVERRLREREAELSELSTSLERRVVERTEELSRANQLLQSRNLELHEFAYVASHDLKEPLRKIRTFAGMLVDEYGETLHEDARLYLDRIQYATERMMALIDDLLSLSRVSTQLAPAENVDFGDLIDATWADLGLDENWSLDNEVRGIPPIEADEVRMRQLVQNILSNAIKYRAEGRQLHLRVTARTVSTGDGLPAVEFAFIDNGIGFDPRHAERIFGAFQRLHGRTEYEGTGMGLAICRRIVDRHGGCMTASGVPGEGAVFTVVLPIRQSRLHDSF
jgi:PAS domain S-box-containing protein